MGDSALERVDSRVRRRLLIVQQNSLAGRSMSRYLEQHFDEVLLAGDELAAEEILSDPEKSPSHLVCGQDFGPDAVCGEELIRRWRARHPSLGRVILATGVLELPHRLEGVDAVFQKPAPPSVLLSLLLSPEGVRSANDVGRHEPARPD